MLVHDETAADAPIRRDVRLLGDLLGRVLVEQEDESLLADVERVRALARAARSGESHDDLHAAVAGLPLERQANVLRAFALYFQLTNVAEQHHRVRRHREYAREERVPRESLEDAFGRIGEQQPPDVSLELVLTAHPTEATRRTVLQAHLRIASLLERLDVGDDITGALAAEITALWQADEVRSQRPHVVDEIRNGHWFFEQSLIDAAERLLAAYRGLRPDAPVPLRFGTWIGGDADGNPNTSAETVHDALDRARKLLLSRYRDDVRALAGELGVSSRLTPVSEELLRSIASDERELEEYAAAIGDQNEDEPYRRKLSFVWHRLVTDAYESAEAFSADLDVLDRSLRANRGARIADGALAALRRRVEIFGFHLAALDVRVHARDLVEPDDRIQALLRAAPGTVIVSGTATAADAARVHDVAPAAHVVPLFESIDALRAAPSIYEELLDTVGCREVMVGYSDSAKDAGYLAAQWEIRKALVALTETARRRGAEVTIFHGRGGSAGRGGGPTYAAILAQPPSEPPGRLKLTEQGETIAFKYGLPGLAYRNLESALAATLLSAVPDRSGAQPPADSDALLEALARHSYTSYRALLDEPGFADFFRAFTPVDELALLNIGSRPSRRPEGAGYFASLRAIPWVFAWTQNRCVLPSWYGCGSAFAVEDVEELRRLYRDWPFFRALVQNLEMTLAKSSIEIARDYLSLVDDSRLWDRIAEEHERTVATVLEIVETNELLDRQPVIQRSVQLRNPYVDPMNAIQVELLARYRGGDLEAEQPLLRSIAGIAAALRNTG